jgi:hypothetical protein
LEVIDVDDDEEDCRILSDPTPKVLHPPVAVGPQVAIVGPVPQQSNLNRPISPDIIIEEVQIVNKPSVSRGPSPSKPFKAKAIPPPPPFISLSNSGSKGRVQQNKPIISVNTTLDAVKDGPASEPVPCSSRSLAQSNVNDVSNLKQSKLSDGHASNSGRQSSTEEKKIVRKTTMAGPASFKRKREELEKNKKALADNESKNKGSSQKAATMDAPKRPTVNVQKGPESVDSMRTVRKDELFSKRSNSSAAYAPNSNRKSSPHNAAPSKSSEISSSSTKKQTASKREIRSSSGDDSSDGMSDDAMRQREFVPNVKSEKIVKNAKPKANLSPREGPSHATVIKQEKTSFNSDCEEDGDIMETLDPPSDSSPKKASKKKLSLIQEIKRRTAVMKLKRVVVLTRDNQIQMMKKFFLGLTQENKQKVYLQFRDSMIRCGKIEAPKESEEQDSVDSDSDSDAASSGTN